MTRSTLVVLLVASSVAIVRTAATAPPSAGAQNVEDCIRYDPDSLHIDDYGPRGWMLLEKRVPLHLFDTRGDAEMGMTVVRAHRAHCFIGRDNQRADRSTYIFEYYR